MRKYKDLFLCANIVIVTIILFFGFLIYNRVDRSQDTYFFQRKYLDYGTKWNVQELSRSDSLDTLQGSTTGKIDSVELYNHTFLAFEPTDTSSIASFAFFRYISIDDSLKRTIENVHVPACDYSNVYEKRLAFDGVFLKKENYVTYTFNHLPLVLVFDKEGNYIRQIDTKDKVPCPSIIRYKQFYIYERGHAFNSNISSFVDGKCVYVFSYRTPKLIKEFMVDAYSLVTGEYKFSIRITNNGYNKNTDIDKIYAVDDNIYIDTRMKFYKLNIQVDNTNE